MVKEKDEDLEDSHDFAPKTQKTEDTLYRGYNTTELGDNKSQRDFDERSVKVSDKLSLKFYSKWESEP